MLTGLLRAAGLWAGATIVKRDYDTFENTDLVRLNRKLMQAAGIGEDYTTQYRADWVRRVAALAARIDKREFSEFVAECENNRPWIWKDPRLWITIGFWQHLLPVTNLRYILLKREQLQAWVSCNLRRQVQTPGYLLRYNSSIEGELLRHLQSQHAEYLPMVYEHLLLRPEQELERLSQFLGLSVHIHHLRAIYAGKLYRRNHGLRDLFTASLIFGKNFRERLC